MMNELKIDKVNGNICYNDEKHLYWDKSKPEEKFTSVTTLINEYAQPFNGDFWSTYKAVERLIDDKNIFKSVKSKLNRFKKSTIPDSTIESLGIDIDKVKEIKNIILQEWEDKKNVACERGTLIHKQKEDELLGHTTINLNKFGLKGEFIVKRDDFNIDVEQGIYPEYLIYFTKYYEEYGVQINLAGQSDVVIIDGDYLDIRDYKTNERIDTKSFFGGRNTGYAKMQFPVNNLMDCNFYHYTLQLSMYAYMIKCLNPHLIVRDLVLEHYDHNNKLTYYECDYLEEECIRLLKHFAKSKKITKELDVLNEINFDDIIL